MAGEIQDVIDQLVIIQKAITGPAGEKDLVEAYDEPPAQITEFPCFYNREEEIGDIRRGAGVRRMFGRIGMHLLFGASGAQKYSVRSRRRWLKAVLDGFDVQLALGLAQLPVQYAPVTNVTFAPLELNGKEYVTATFWLDVQWTEAF